MNKKIISGLLFAAVAASWSANAAITTETLLNFNKGNPPTTGVESTPGNTGMLLSSYSGFANIAPLSNQTPPSLNGNCTGTGTLDCYYEDGLVVGIVRDNSNSSAHLHRDGTSTNNKLGYHSDASGIYIRAQDSSAFKLTSLDFLAPAAPGNPDANGTYIDPDTDLEVTGVAGPNDFWEILGYASALNPTLDADPNSGSWIARQTVTNGFKGNLVLDATFHNISAFWIHYHGYQQTPADGKSFAMELDNVIVNAPAAVPVPAAVWMFLSGMMGLLAIGKRKSHLPV